MEKSKKLTLSSVAANLVKLFNDEGVVVNITGPTEISITTIFNGTKNFKARISRLNNHQEGRFRIKNLVREITGYDGIIFVINNRDENKLIIFTSAEYDNLIASVKDKENCQIIISKNQNDAYFISLGGKKKEITDKLNRFSVYQR